MTTPLHEKVFPEDERVKLPRPFILRRLHSLLGIWLAIYLCEHLLVNSQMALYFEDDGSMFVRMVNSIHSIPYLRAVEIIFLGLPFAIHGAWGVKYALTAKANSGKANGRQPSLSQYRRNRAFTWQRITSWVLIVGIVAHVVQMRFVDYPFHVQITEGKSVYLNRLTYEPALALVAQKLRVKLYDRAQIHQKEEELGKGLHKHEGWIQAAQKFSLKKGDVLSVAPSPGAAFFLVVLQTFMDPMLVILYSILVVAAAYHGFNGLWTFMITWGFTLTRRSQRAMHVFTSILMGIVMFLGLLSAWGSYWVNLALK